MTAKQLDDASASETVAAAVIQQNPTEQKSPSSNNSNMDHVRDSNTNLNGDSISDVHDDIPVHNGSLSSLTTSTSTSTNTSSSSSAGSITLKHNSYSCTCQFLKAEHCSLCSRIIPEIAELDNQKAQLIQNANTLRQQIMEHGSILHKYNEEKNELQGQFDIYCDRLNDLNKKVESLKRDIEVVELKHQEEIAHTKAIEQSKKGVESELHDLTQRLFEEANTMILAEKAAKTKLQESCDNVKIKLQQAEIELNDVQGELYDLREAMGKKKEEDDTVEQLSTRENYLLRAQLDISALTNHPQPVRIHAFQADSNDSLYSVDSMLLTEFEQFVRALQAQSSLAKLHNIPFMKDILKRDIEPCLKSVITSHHSHHSHNNHTTMKKILEAMLAKTCFLEYCTPDNFRHEIAKQRKSQTTQPRTRRKWFSYSSSSSSSSASSSTTCTDITPAVSASTSTPISTTSSQSNTPVTIHCYTCHRVILDTKESERERLAQQQGDKESDTANTHQEYLPVDDDIWKFRLSYFDEWSLIDKHCYSRIASVNEFYIWVRKLQVGVYNHMKMSEIYEEFTRLQLQILLSRMGALPSMLEDFGDGLGPTDTTTTKAKKIGSASAGLK